MTLGHVSTGPQESELTETHQEGLNDFLDRERMGFIQDVEHVAGFQPHQFRQMPTTLGQWQISKLELISLLRHKEPVAYVSKYLPNMEKLKEVSTRPLDTFESAALERLRTEQDLVIQDGVNHIRMVGSLRAADDCLQCHSVQRGELLGAFTYLLERVEAVPNPKPIEPDAAARLWKTRSLRHPTNDAGILSFVSSR